ncbi:MAG: hypothetical protein SGARI_006894, partial [Bacillariaceae sp.]
MTRFNSVILQAALLLLATDAATAFAPTSTSARYSPTAFSTAASTDVVIEHNHCQEPGDRDILIRAARGEKTERTPVWLMRQAGRYMAAFREYSTKYAFRQRSETPSMATEL